MYKLLFMILAAAAAFGITYLLSMSSSSMPQQMKYIISGVAAGLVFLGFWLGYVRV